MMEKTCGNCSHCRPIEWSCDSEKSGFNYIVDADESWCHGKAWKPRTDTIEQRYQQLAQLTKGIFALMVGFNRIIVKNNIISSLTAKIGEDEINAIRDDIEELGVSLDD